jgi:hypothetical protein
MTSALTAIANSSLTLELPTVGTTIDQLTGNVLPVVEPVTVGLYLREGGRSGSGFPGVDTDSITLEGYAVNPQALDARVRPGVTGQLIFAGKPACRCEVLQERFPYGTTGLLGGTLQAVLGDKIRLRVFIDG